MLYFNQRNWFKMSPDGTVPVPSTAKEYYLAKMAGLYDGELPDPKTPTEFYLAKMAGVEVVGNIEKVFEQEFTFGTEPDSKGNYNVTISNAYDTERFDSSHFITHLDGNDDNPSFYVVDLLGDGIVNIRGEDASYAGTTHTLELFYKTVIEDVPVKTRTEQYLKAIAAKQDSSDSSESGGASKG